MDTVELPREDAIRLLTGMLRELDSRIAIIVERWNKKSAEAFLKESRTGTIENAEMDAITVTNLLEERDKISKLYDQIG